VVVGGGVWWWLFGGGGLEGRFSNRFWLESSLGKAEQYSAICFVYNPFTEVSGQESCRQHNAQVCSL
jgi:hypothetical protein